MLAGRDAVRCTGCRLRYGCLASTRQSGKAGRHGRTRSTGRHPIQIKAQGTLLRRAADTQHSYPGGLWIPGQGQADAAPAHQMQTASDHSSSSLPVSPNNCPSVCGSPAQGGRLFHPREQRPAEGLWVRAPLCLLHAQAPASSRDGINAAFQCHRQQRRVEAGKGRLQLCVSHFSPFLNRVSWRHEPRATDVKLSPIRKIPACTFCSN